MTGECPVCWDEIEVKHGKLSDHERDIHPSWGIEGKTICEGSGKQPANLVDS